MVSFGTRDLPWVMEYVRNQRERHGRGKVEDWLELITVLETEIAPGADPAQAWCRAPVNNWKDLATKTTLVISGGRPEPETRQFAKDFQSRGLVTVKPSHGRGAQWHLTAGHAELSN